MLRPHAARWLLARCGYTRSDFRSTCKWTRREGAPKGLGFRHFRLLITGPNSTGTHHLCCDSPDLVADTGCVMGDVLIAPPDDGREPEPGWPWVRRVAKPHFAKFEKV